MNSPFTIGRSVVPWIVVTPDVMLNGRVEYACSMPLTWKPCVSFSQSVVRRRHRTC